MHALLTILVAVSSSGVYYVRVLAANNNAEVISDPFPSNGRVVGESTARHCQEGMHASAG